MTYSRKTTVHFVCRRKDVQGASAVNQPYPNQAFITGCSSRKEVNYEILQNEWKQLE